MTPFALAHLSVSWSSLTSLRLNVPAPWPTAAAGAAVHGIDPSGPEEAFSDTLDSVAAQMFVSLGLLCSLKHLQLTMTGTQPSQPL